MEENIGRVEYPHRPRTRQSVRWSREMLHLLVFSRSSGATSQDGISNPFFIFYPGEVIRLPLCSGQRCGRMRTLATYITLNYSRRSHRRRGQDCFSCLMSFTPIPERRKRQRMEESHSRRRDLDSWLAGYRATQRHDSTGKHHATTHSYYFMWHSLLLIYVCLLENLSHFAYGILLVLIIGAYIQKYAPSYSKFEEYV